MENTNLFSREEMECANAKFILKEVSEILKERGYNPINQIVGYLLSGDPGYVTSYKDAREKITSLDRADLLAYLLKGYL